MQYREIQCNTWHYPGNIGGAGPASRHAANIIKQGWDLGRLRVMGGVGLGEYVWQSVNSFDNFVFFATMLILSYLRLHANSTDKIEIEQHCTLLMQNSQ